MAVAGSIFMAVLNTIASLQTTVNEDTAAYWSQDITVNFQTPERMYEAAPAALSIPGVEKVEAWVTANAFRDVPDDSRGRENIAVFGVPPESSRTTPERAQTCPARNVFFLITFSLTRRILVI